MLAGVRLQDIHAVAAGPKLAANNIKVVPTRQIIPEPVPCSAMFSRLVDTNMMMRSGECNNQHISEASIQLSSPLRDGAPKSSPFSNHLFTYSLQTDSFEIGKNYSGFNLPHSELSEFPLFLRKGT
jgi:hypothetical protein